MAAAERFIVRCREAGFSPRLVRAAYEIEPPLQIIDVRVAQPMDYLGSAQLDVVHADVLEWLRRLPSTVLKSGKSLADWSAGPEYPAPVWAWLTALGPYVQICLRTVRLTRAVVDAEKPAAWALLGNGPDAGWQAPLMREQLALAVPEAQSWDDACAVAPVSPSRSWRRPNLDALFPHLPLGFYRRREAYRKVEARLAAQEAEVRERIRDYDGHVVLISRGQRGAHWLVSRARGRPVLIDEYSEGMPDALAEACVRRNWRLTIIWESPRPVFEGKGYADRWPSHVAELTLADFGGWASQLRAPTRTRYAHALNKLTRDPGFRRAMRVDGVDMFGPYADYFNRMLLDLAVLTATQAEAWGKAFTLLRPDIVTAGRLESRPWINRAAFQTGARTASIKLGIGDEMALSLMATRPNGEPEIDHSPDALIVWGEHQVRHLARRLPDSEMVVHAAGRTRSDTFVNEGAPTQADIDTVRGLLGLRPTGPVIVWGGTCRSRWGLWPGQAAASAVMAPESWRACLEALCLVAADVGGQVLVKPHPADDQVFVAREVARMDPDVCVLSAAVASVHNHQLLAAADVFVSSVSSMFAEAALAGKVSVNVWTPEISMIYETARFEQYANLAAPATSVEAMASTTRQLLTDAAAYERELTRAIASMPIYFGGLDGRNAERTSEWLLDFAKANRSGTHES